MLTTLPDSYTPRTPPLAHQREALLAGCSRTFFAYFLEMGLGKSRILIDDFCINYADDRVDGLVVVAPKGVYTNWTRVDRDNPGELQRWLWAEHERTARVHAYRAGKRAGDLRERQWLLDRGAVGPAILLVNAEALSSTDDAVKLIADFCRAHRTMLVIDESTLAKNPTAKRTKLLIKLAPLSVMRRILTGSPSTGSNSDLWAQFQFLQPGVLGYPHFRVFQARYCKMVEMLVGGRTIRKEAGPANSDELQSKIAKHSFRRRKRDCLDLPEKEYRRWEVPLTREQMEVYRDLRSTAMAKVRDSEVTTELVVTQLMRMHSVVCGHIRTDDKRVLRLDSRRMDAVEEIVGATEESVVIWCHFREDAALVAGRLGEVYGRDSVAEFHGGIGQKQREVYESDFQAGRRRFMVATDAGARGRTWTAATLVIIYSNGYDLEVRTQLEDRTHRIGTVGTVTYVDLVAAGTVDEKIIAALRGKRDVARAVVADGLDAWI